MNILNAKKYFTFALKSGNVVFGTDNIIKAKKIELVIVSNSLSENAKSKLENFAQKKHCLIETLDDEQLFELVQNQAVKAFAILDFNIAKAMQN